MKKITLFLLTILISYSAWGATINKNTKFYLSVNDNWNRGDERYAAYFFGNGEAWVSMTDNGNGIYTCNSPSDKTFENVIFCRMNGSNQTNNWDNKWDQTNDLTFDGTHNCYSIGEKKWTKYSTIKFYLKIKNDKNWESDNAKFVAYFYNTNNKAWGKAKKLDALTRTYYIEVPNNIAYTNVIFLRKNNDKTNWEGEWNRIQTTYSTNNNLYTVTDWGSGKWGTYIPEKVNLSGDFGTFVNLSVSNNTATKEITQLLEPKAYNITVTDGTDLWSISHSITLTKTATKIKIEVDAKNKSIKITPTYVVDQIFTNTTNLAIGTYGKLSYELTMPQNRWYWIVLPYNVNVLEIKTSTGGGWNDLVFTEYNAQHRAEGKNGWINWKTEYTNEGKAVPTQLQANKGYVIGPKDGPFNQDGDFVVTFPSASTTNTVAGEATDLTATNTGGTTINDNWNIIGTGLYHNASLEGINYVALPAVVNGKDSYEYRYITSSKEPFFTEQIGTNSFAPFEAFFVQYGGDYSATTETTKSAAELAPVARAKAQEQEQIYLINMNEAHTVVILNAEGSEGYTAGEDFLEMNIGSRIEMIYSFDAEDALAFNHRATEAQSIALGGYVAVAGEQTISLDAYNGNAEAVTLIDNVTGTTTDLLAEDYTFTAEVGSLDGRFTIVFAAQKAGSDTTVDCYNSIANQVIAYGTADHCTVSGLTAGEAIVVYNTMGQLVFATTADSETITLPSLTAGNYLILHNGTTNKVTLR